MELHAVDLVYDFCIMSVLLFIAKIIRVRVKVIQNLYIPTALLAGAFGLIFGKSCLNIIPFSGEISNYSAILIVVLFATLFLGSSRKASFKNMIQSVGDTFLVNASSEMCQFGLFILIGITALPLVFKNINLGFGLMLPSGFVGGHGTAAAIGSVFAENGWEEAISIGQTFATIGLLSGIVGGVILINIGARKGYTRIIKRISALPEEMKTGLVPESKQEFFGKNTINAMSMDTLTWHLTLILIAVGGAYWLNFGLNRLIPKLSIPVYGLALICSIFLQKILQFCKLSHAVDKKIITHIGSSSTDFLVAFGVASINIKVIMKYWLPIVILAAVGIVWTVLWHVVISRRFFRNYWFERSMYIYGMSSGVLATGVILLRICDPNFETGVLEDFGFAWIFLSVMDMLIVSLAPMSILSGNGLLFGGILILLSALSLGICAKMFGFHKEDGRLKRADEL